MRRALLTVVGLVVLTSVASVALAIPPIPEGVLIQESTPGVGCHTLLSTGDGIAIFGQGANFENTTTGNASVVNTGFWSFQLAPNDIGEVAALRSSGAYVSEITCVGGVASQTIRVRVKAPASPATNSFSVTWAIPSAPNSWRYDVQVKVGVGGAWRNWRNDTAKLSGTYVGREARTYFFRARTVRPSVPAMTDWSPSRRVQT